MSHVQAERYDGCGHVVCVRAARVVRVLIYLSVPDVCPQETAASRGHVKMAEPASQDNEEDYVCTCAKGFEGQNCEKGHTHPHAHGDLLSTSGGVVLLVILSLGGLFVLVGVCYCCFPALRPLYVPPTTSEGEAHVSSAQSHVTPAQADLGSGSYQHSWKAASLAHGTAPLPAGVLSKSVANSDLGYDAAYVHAPAAFEGAYIHAPAAFEGAYVHADKPHRYLRTAASVDEGGGKHPAKATKRPTTPPPTYDESLWSPRDVMDLSKLTSLSGLVASRPW
ncbi:hypothetical protein C0Q70_14297 [Pomacea canaliculata]|uniref:EGF-like domain-containing protein n=1 Tax=Pomacea canaliculata TaxID=400727 RepID=A0A2T7NZM8_POMCA|nr:hypothetical protein C0Q70_14297 [Pomacea canaliculata]